MSRSAGSPWPRTRPSRTRPATLNNTRSGIPLCVLRGWLKFAASTWPRAARSISRARSVAVNGTTGTGTSGSRMTSLRGTCRCFPHPQTEMGPSRKTPNPLRHPGLPKRRIPLGETKRGRPFRFRSGYSRVSTFGRHSPSPRLVETRSTPDWRGGPGKLPIPRRRCDNQVYKQVGRTTQYHHLL